MPRRSELRQSPLFGSNRSVARGRVTEGVAASPQNPTRPRLQRYRWPAPNDPDSGRPRGRDVNLDPSAHVLTGQVQRLVRPDLCEATAEVPPGESWVHPERLPPIQLLFAVVDTDVGD